MPVIPVSPFPIPRGDYIHRKILPREALISSASALPIIYPSNTNPP